MDKDYYYYIDEAGAIENDSKYFILGCFKTDSPELLREEIIKLKYEILNSPYFAFERKKFIKQGFHACENHYDIRAKFYNLISVLNIRAYILVVNKESELFKSFVEEGLDFPDIYIKCVEKLMTDRLLKTRKSRNIITFEQVGNKTDQWKDYMQKGLEKVSAFIKESTGDKITFNIKIKGKNEELLSVIDYILYLFVQFYEKSKFEPRMIENFKIIEPKIGIIYKMDRDIFYHKNNRINIREY